LAKIWPNIGERQRQVSAILMPQKMFFKRAAAVFFSLNSWLS
jgi:hypothetical protein